MGRTEQKIIMLRLGHQKQMRLTQDKGRYLSPMVIKQDCHALEKNGPTALPKTNAPIKRSGTR
jgi:hypothetical protein